MTKPLETVEAALALHQLDWNVSQIARALDVSRYAVRDWVLNADAHLSSLRRAASHTADACPLIASLPRPQYSYLFGQYLGDGCISPARRDVFKLRIATCDAYPDIRARTIAAMEAVMPTSTVGVVGKVGCSEVYSHSKHWPCLFPQHGPGRKHDRLIALARWQQEIVDECPQEFVAGLIHSDGCRTTNKVKNGVTSKEYEYARYFFTNVSEDILDIFCAALDHIGVEWKQNRWNCISIAKKESVAILDSFIGRKT